MTDTLVEPRIVVNLGSGHVGPAGLPAFFKGWRHVRVDVDPDTTPDVLTSITDLSAIQSGSVAAVWASHCIEHLYQHETAVALREVLRILSGAGFLCVRVPDLQAVAGLIADDKMHEVVYVSKSGPVTPHDMIFGFGPDIAAGRLAMAHRSGFTPSLLVDSLQAAGFTSFVVRRTRTLELVAVARKGAWSSDAEPGALLRALGF